MHKAAQTVNFLLSILSVIVLMASMAGIALTWEFRRIALEELSPRLDAIESDLRLAQSDLQTVKNELDAAQTEIDALQSALKTLGVEGAGSLQALADIVGRVENAFTPFISTVAERVESLRNALLQIKAIIESLNQLPLVNIEIPGIEQLDAAAAALLELQTQIETGRDKVSQASQVTQDTITALTTGFSDLETSIQTLSAALSGYNDKISAYLIELERLQANLPRWANWSAVFFTLVFAWLGISQKFIFFYTWRVATGKDLLRVIR